MSIFDYEQMLIDYEVNYKPINSRNWISIQCPLCCNDGKFHAALNPDREFMSCYKCGNHNLWDVIPLLTNQSWGRLRIKYKTDLDLRDKYILENTDYVERPTKLRLPTGVRGLCDRAKRYLESRRFDSHLLEEKYKICSAEERGDYKFRILFPIFFESKMISYTGRDYSGKSPLRYLSCPGANEILCHKHIAFGWDDLPDNRAIIVEGIMDKMRLGDHAVALFGSSYTPQQVLLLGSLDQAIILFDN